MNIVIIGAGQSGRGFIPQFLNENDTIYFIDKDESIINDLNRVKEYRINYYDSDKSINVSNYSAYTWKTVNRYVFDECQFIGVSVGEQNLADVAEELTKFIDVFQDKVFVLFENGTNPAQKFEEILHTQGITQFTVTQCAIFTTTNNDGIDIISEDYLSLSYDVDRYSGEFPFNYAVPTKDFELLLKRKIFTYNCLSAVISYPGYFYGFKFLSEAANDERIRRLVDNVVSVLNEALAIEFQISLQEQIKFSQRALKKFTSTFIRDDIYRNVRDVKRKLGMKERLFGPIQIIDKLGMDVLPILKIVGFALLYSYEIDGKDPISLLLEVTGLSSDHPWIVKSIGFYEEFKRKRGLL